MARSRHGRVGILDRNQYESFTLDQTNKIKEPDTFAGINTFEHVVKRGERLDHLAARFLGDDDYWWIIAVINNMTLPFPSPGDKILVPISVSDVLERI
jgi:hypothetical protein